MKRRQSFLFSIALCGALSLGLGEAPGQSSLPPGMSTIGSDGHMILAGVELALPMFIEAFDTRLTRYLEAVGERSVTRIYSDKELYMVLISKVQADHPGAIQEPLIRIHPEGFHGSIRLNFGGISAKLQGKVVLKPINDRLHVHLQELYVNGQFVSLDLLKVMEREVNQMIDSGQFNLKVIEFSTREGTVLISVEVR